ncbi:formate dehydrogenase accessory sulfurtransferase FdhD [Rothia nasisuis]|nr:formate dehydrogenase accessory sulfurtransferase FdhD [Rothia nasisuis]
MGRLNRAAPATRYVLKDDGTFSVGRRADALTAEEPLEIRLDGTTVTTTMRTPGHDIELAHGFLHAEGLLVGADDISTARYCAGTGPDGANTYNVLDMASANPALTAERLVATQRGEQGPAQSDLPFPAWPGGAAGTPLRLTVTNSACGVCGSASIDSIMGKATRPIPPTALTPEQVLELPARLRDHQVIFKKTGGIHAAAVFDPHGELLVAREDIGRHNAVDKVVGHLLMNGRLEPPAPGLPGRTLVVSSRASFELVQKAVMAGFAALVAVSAPSSLAVDLAQESGLTLIAFARENRFNLYSGSLD